MEQRHNVTMEQRHNGTTSQWNNVTMEQRHNGTTSQWNNVTMEQRHNETTIQASEALYILLSESFLKRKLPTIANGRRKWDRPIRDLPEEGQWASG
ncbi:hypothetical protein ACOMHN_060391 [Nucella lapillus]